MKINLKHFFSLVKAQQKPGEDALLEAMQEKVNWIKKTSTYDLNQRQKVMLEKDKALVVAVENYIAIQHRIINHLFEKLETSQLEAATHFNDKIYAEASLRNYIQQNGKVQPAA
jgi:hypothetical protein